MNKQSMGEMIATLRKEQNMTQIQLAQQMGVTDKAVSKWERDLSYPDVNSLPRLADVLGVSVDEMLKAKRELKENGLKASFDKILSLILKVVPLAMGLAVIVLSILNELEVSTGLTLLGIGVFGLALDQLHTNNKN